MAENGNKNVITIVISVIWLGILAYLITLMLDICKPPEPLDNTTNNNTDNTFDYTENFEPNDPADAGSNAANVNEVANQDVNFNPPLDNSETLLENVVKEDEEEDDELVVEGTDALIAASSDRFYSIDTKGQTNRNASNDLRGDLPIAYNATYTPFNQSAIYGEPLVPGGRL